MGFNLINEFNDMNEAWEWTSARNGNADGEVPDVIIDDFDF